MLICIPIVDMEALIRTMMQWAGVYEEILSREQEIPTEFGETLSWKYLLYAQENPLKIWNSPTSILYGELDNLTENSTITSFSHAFSCNLDIVPQGEHWFHTPEHLAALQTWTQRVS